MNMVVLDGYPGNPGDLSWRAIEAFGNLRVYDRTSDAETVERCKDAEVVLINKVPLRACQIAQLPKLKYVGVLATGYNMVDIAAAKEAGVVVTNVPGYSSGHVAQLTFALVLELADRVGLHDGAVKEGQWERCPDFTFRKSKLIELAGKKIGIVGYGSIGRRVGEIARAFGMEVLATAHRDPKAEEGVSFLPLEDLLSQADVVTLHCPLTAQNRHMIDARRLALMKATAFLINTARGPLIDEEALAEALKKGQIAGAGLDVLCQEPPAPGTDFLRLPNLVVTPHIAWSSDEARRRLMDMAGANLKAWVEGHPVNVVNP